MPFRKKARIELVSQHKNVIPAFFYQIDYCLYDTLPDTMLYFFAKWNRESVTVKKKDYTILDNVYGKGIYVGTYLAPYAACNCFFHALLPLDVYLLLFTGNVPRCVFMNGMNNNIYYPLQPRNCFSTVTIV